MCAAGRGTTEQVTNPLDPLLLRLSEDFIDDEDLSRRLKRLFKVTQPRRGPSKRPSTCTDPSARHGQRVGCLACRRPAPCADLERSPRLLPTVDSSRVGMARISGGEAHAGSNAWQCSGAVELTTCLGTAQSRVCPDFYAGDGQRQLGVPELGNVSHGPPKDGGPTIA